METKNSPERRQNQNIDTKILPEEAVPRQSEEPILPMQEANEATSSKSSPGFEHWQGPETEAAKSQPH